MSPDSFYDTLQSELEASDSGCGGSVIQSARSAMSGADTADMSDLCITSARKYTNVTDDVIMEVNSERSQSLQDMAHRAVSSMSRQSMEPEDPMNASMIEQDEEENDNHLFNESAATTALLAALSRCHVGDEENQDPMGDHQVDPPRQSTPFLGRSSSDIKSMSQMPLLTPVSTNRTSTGSQRSSPPQPGPLSRVMSTDSLCGYEGPAMGQPGVPGTRDLEYAMRRLQLRRRVERDYEQFRRERGYGASKHTPNTQSLGITERRSNRSSCGACSSRLRIMKPIEGSHTLRKWRALAMPSPVGTVAHSISTESSLTDVVRPASSLNQHHHDLSPSSCAPGICMRQDAVSPSTPASSANSSAFFNSRPTAPGNSTAVGLACYSCPRALRAYVARRNPMGAAVGIEAACSPPCPLDSGVLTRTDSKQRVDSADELD